MYDIESMKEAIKKCDDNIKTFEDAITNELKTQQQYKAILRELEVKNGDDNGKA